MSIFSGRETDLRLRMLGRTICNYENGGRYCLNEYRLRFVVCCGVLLLLEYSDWLVD
jgi:hypothetical protein